MFSDTSFETDELNQALYDLCVEARKEPIKPEHKNRKTAIVIAGPTACGKSDFSMLLAKEIGGEIISADSMQIYRHANIGTAKASMADRLAIPHHLIDVRDICDPFTVVDFYEEASQACREILERGNVPIFVGGSGFYLHSLLFGPPLGPPPAPEVRRSIEADVERYGLEAMYQKLLKLDEEYAESITCHDKHKIVRALEIITLTAKKVSDLKWKARSSPKNFDFRCWFLYRPKETLYRRIDRRCLRMVEAGLLDEVQQLEQLGLLENPSATQAIGYRQALEYLKSDKSQEAYQEFLRRFKQASRRYAKRQFTWFRREPLFRWLDVDAHDFEMAMEIILKDFERLI